MSFLGLEGLHAFVTGAAGGIGSAVVRELLDQGCKVSAHDLRPITSFANSPNLLLVSGDITSESSIQSSISEAVHHHGPINILIANAGITDESSSYPIWQLPLELWQRTQTNNLTGTFLTIKHFLLSAETYQTSTGSEMENLSIVITGSECGKFGQAGHSEYASGKAGLQYGLIRSVKNEIVRLNSKARINAVAPGWVDTPLIEGRLDDPKEMWREAQATVPLRKIAQPEDVARTMVFLASHRVAGHISGECLSVDGGMEGRVVWSEKESTIPPQLSLKPKRKIQVLLSIDFDAVSGFLGTGASPLNNMAAYSSGIFAAKLGVPRLLSLLAKHDISSSVTWFVPGHSLESFPEETKMILDSGAEIGCHGYAHEGCDQMTETQEKEVIERCVELNEKLTGRRPRGWRAPLYQLREHTITCLEEQGFLYDSSLTHHDSQPYFLPRYNPPITAIDFSPHLSASTWMQPLPKPEPPHKKTLVELPGNWYMEDMTPLQFLPSAPNSQGYIPPAHILSMWKSRFSFLYHEDKPARSSPSQAKTEVGVAETKGGKDDEENDAGFIFPLILHPDTSGMPHVIGMIDQMIAWLRGWGEEVTFGRYEDVATEWRSRQRI